MDEQLELREMALKGLKEHYERKLEDEIRSAKLDLEANNKAKVRNHTVVAVQSSYSVDRRRR